MAEEKKGQSANNAVDNTGNSLRDQLIQILENLLPACQDQAWLTRQINSVKHKKLEESYFYMSNIATVFWYLLREKQNELVIPKNKSTEKLRDFLKMCHDNFEIIKDPNESIEETTTRILNEMSIETKTMNFRSK